MKWVEASDGKTVSGPYTIYRGIKYFSVSYKNDTEMTLINNHCESLSAAKSLAAHDWELRLKAEAATGSEAQPADGATGTRGGIGVVTRIKIV